MSSDKTRGLLIDILCQIDLAESFTSGLTESDFLQTPLHFYAATRCLEIISEASRRLPDEHKSRHPDIEWRDMAGAGNIYRHDYGDVAPRRIWQAVKRALPRLRSVIEVELGRFG
jgi:uncharacterized protein with HEPN domain